MLPCGVLSSLFLAIGSMFPFVLIFYWDRKSRNLLFILLVDTPKYFINRFEIIFSVVK